MTRTLQSLSKRPHKVTCTTHGLVAKAPNEAYAIFLAGEHEGKFKECKGKVSYYPSEAISQERETSKLPGGSEGGTGGEIK